MRTVVLDGRAGNCPNEHLRKKLCGHLNARLNEYAEDGISSRIEEGGTVLARINGVTGAEAVRALSLRGVFALRAEAQVRFVIGPETSFEDLDYVQSAVAGLLDG